jgi:hypothetical protein
MNKTNNESCDLFLKGPMIGWEIIVSWLGENTGNDKMEDVYVMVLESISNVMAFPEIEQGKIGVLSTVHDNYYLLQ